MDWARLLRKWMKERHENGKCVSVERTDLHRDREGNIATLAREGGLEHLFEMSLDLLNDCV